MNAAEAIREADEVAEMLRLVEDKQYVFTGSHKGRRALSLLACLEKRLHGLRRRLLEAALTDVLWQYMDYCGTVDRAALVRQLIADIGARS